MSKSTTKKITVVIPTFNCAKRFQECLESVKWADEIIVVDMHSTDNTLKIAKKYGCKIIFNVPKDGNFDKNRLLGMNQAKGDWILKLDSDEKLSDKLQDEIKDMLAADDGRYNGYCLYNHIYMLGCWIKHGFIKANSNELRLVRNGKWSYNPFRYHQLIEVSGDVAFLKFHYDHFVFDTVGEFISKTNKYTETDAVYFSKSNKVNLIVVILAPIKSFTKLFILQQGYMDGAVGFAVVLLFSIYNLIEKLKAWQLQKFRIL